MEKKTIILWAVFIAVAIPLVTEIRGFVVTILGYFNAKAQSSGYYSYNGGFFGLMKTLDVLILLAVAAIIVLCLMIALAGKSEKANKNFAFSIIGCFAFIIIATIIARCCVPVDMASGTSAASWNNTDKALYTSLRDYVVSIICYLGVFSAIVVVPLFHNNKGTSKPKVTNTKSTNA